MATRGPIVQTQVPGQLCDLCHQKPKFSNHQYCSKTCAAQAATLCNHCHKKPKFQNFDYCGKNCATLAGGTVVRPQVGVGANPVQQQVPTAKAVASNAKTTTSKNFNPIQVAKLVAQHIPQLSGSTNVAPSVPTAQPAGQAAAGAAPLPAAQNNNPFMNLTNQQQPPQQVAPNGTSTQAPASTQPLQCLIPGCGKPVHVDTQGNTTSDYCSRKHREEAVAMGLAIPCIMCLALPQSDVDYFCGKACRDEALNKI
ncbi:hypothetical protein AX14_005328 [Amanita brunnescens Koide BX004]|nr:hypothetical protein AX14_005328 [Amanita brunnescens Koide BX004]